MDSEESGFQTGGRFNLVRYFVLASLVALVGVALLSALIFGALMRYALIKEAEADAIAVARLMAGEFNAELDTLTQAGVPIRWIDPAVQERLSTAFMRSGGTLGVVKIKAFDTTGQIIYSTDRALIGQIDAGNPDLKDAMAGRVSSVLARAENVADLSGETFTVDVIETYVPVPGDPDGPLQVFEIYQDASDILNEVAATQRLVVASVTGIMLLLFVVLYLIVRRADQIIAQQTADLQEANAELRRLEQLRDDLTHMIVHDMKNPVASIIGYSDLLGRVSPLTETQIDFVEKIHLGSQRLLTMIGNLLDISRLEEGRLELKREAVPVHQVIEPPVSEITPLFQVTDKTLHLDLADDLPSLWADRDLITRVVGNLLSNAEKHTDTGGNVWIVGQIGAVPGTLTLSVRDDGEGIPPEFQDVIFEKFGQAKGRRLGRKTDTGLGLAFCRLAVEAHGGTISVSSEVGQGSSFVLTLPTTHAGDRTTSAA
jgi:signal transduction histidine kinase